MRRAVSSLRRPSTRTVGACAKSERLRADPEASRSHVPSSVRRGLTRRSMLFVVLAVLFAVFLLVFQRAFLRVKGVPLLFYLSQCVPPGKFVSRAAVLPLDYAFLLIELMLLELYLLFRGLIVARPLRESGLRNKDGERKREYGRDD